MNEQPLAQQAAKPMTWDEMKKMLREHFDNDGLTGDDYRLIRVVEAEVTAPLLARIAEMERIEAAARNLVKVKGRYHAEQAFKALEELLGNTGDKR